MIVVNQAKCNKCGDKPISAHKHDFRYCQCGNMFVDGGMDYQRRGTNTDWYDVTEMSYSLPDDVVNLCKEAVTRARKSQTSDLEIALAVIRQLHDFDFLKEWKNDVGNYY